MSTAFDNVRLPADIEAGALVGPRFQTSVVSMAGGKEQRNADWDQERLTANISYGIMQKDDPEDIENSFARIMRFFRARMGRHRSFLFRDLTDFEAVQSPLYSDETGKVFQLVATYGEYRRRITRPEAASLAITVNGVLVPAGADTWALGELGAVTFKTAFPGAVVADFLFDVPMRFDSDVAQVAIEYANAGSIAAIDLIQSRE